MHGSAFELPISECNIIWRYLDGVSSALARRFDGGSSPSEPNLTFLLCELLDAGTTALHVLEYPLQKAKEDLALADGGYTLDVSFETHEHTGWVENRFSGADLGVVFVIEHPLLGRSERGVLLQAKRLYPNSNGFRLDSSFKHFDEKQWRLLTSIEHRFSVQNSIFYLWYCPSSTAFAENDAKLVRSLEATINGDWRDLIALEGWHPMIDELLELGWRGGGVRQHGLAPRSEEEAGLQSWRSMQPATRVSSLSVVNEVVGSSGTPGLLAMYQARANGRQRRRRWRWLHFEPFADLFLLGLTSRIVGDSSPEWIRLARGQKVPLPPPRSSAASDDEAMDLPDELSGARHTLTFTLRSSLHWPQDLPRFDGPRQ